MAPRLLSASLFLLLASACQPGASDAVAGPASASAPPGVPAGAAPPASSASVVPVAPVPPPAPADPMTIGLRVRGVDRPVRLSEARKSAPPVTLKTTAPAYHGAAKVYRGVDLGALLVEEGASLDGDVTLTFVCNDGYRSQIPASLIKKHRAVLAWAEVDAAGKEIPLEPVQLAGGKRVDPSPFYVVWDPASIKESYPAGWPFGVLRIEVAEVSAAAPLDPDRLAPSEANASVREGFAIWSRICFACHSLSGVGGRMGPELNRPVNVTTYFARPVLERYIRDWQTVREAHGNEKMPRLTDLISEAEVRAVVDYLAWMSGRVPR